MKNLGWLFLAIFIAYSCAVVAALSRYRLRGRLGAFVGWCFVPIILLCPMVIPSANLTLRAASAFYRAISHLKSLIIFGTGAMWNDLLYFAITTDS